MPEKEPYAPNVDDWLELRDRLHRAAVKLGVPGLAERDPRLVGKAQGCRLALSYMDDAERLTARIASTAKDRSTEVNHA